MFKKKSLYLLILTFLAFAASSRADIIPSIVFIQNYTINEYKASCLNWGLAIAPDGYLYVANNSGLLVFDGNNWQLHKLPDQLAVKKVTYRDGKIYTQSDSGLAYWERDSIGKLRLTNIPALPDTLRFKREVQTYPLPKEVTDMRPTCYAAVGRFNVTGTERNGLYITDNDGKILLHLTRENQLADDQIRFICVQDPTKIWVATDNGLSAITLETSLSLLGTRNHIGKLNGATLKGNLLYIRTSYGYFKKEIDKNSLFQPVSDEEGTENIRDAFTYPTYLHCNDIFRDMNGLDFFAKSNDIYPVGNELYWLIVGEEAGLFERENGSASLKCRIKLDNYGLNFCVRGQKIFPLDQNLYLASTMQGTLLIDTREFISGSITGKHLLHINHIAFEDENGKQLLPPASTDITLPHDFKLLDINAGTTIFTPNHQISYMLEGISNEWSEWQENGSLHFLQLPKGDYKLRIRKYIVKGPFPEISINIHVKPAWYSSFWAYTAYFLLLYLLLFIGICYHFRKAKRKERLNTEKKQKEEEENRRRIRHELLQKELEDKQNELARQTSSLVKKSQALQELLEEFERQKEQLGDRYPNKFYNRIHAMLTGMLNDKENWDIFESYFNEAHRDFIQRLKSEYQDITTGDIRICCLLRMNLSTKEIASLMNISVRAVELRRYRLRKRLQLGSDTNLVEFLMKY